MTNELRAPLAVLDRWLLAELSLSGSIRVLGMTSTQPRALNGTRSLAETKSTSALANQAAMWSTLWML